MNAQQFAGNIVLVVLLMGLAALIEAAVPLHASKGTDPRRRRANLALTALSFVFNWGLTAAGALLLATLPAPAVSGFNGYAALPVALQMVVGIAVLDFFYGYLAHRLMHASPLLWRYHRVHHADEFVDVTTTYRTHPVEALWRYAFLMAPAWLLAVSPVTLAVYRLLSVVNAIFEHANIRVRERLDAFVSTLWVTPNMHKVHHSRDPRETDTNYGNILAIHDRLLGTFTPSARAFEIRYGLEDVGAEEGRTLARLLAMPFRGGKTIPGARGVAEVMARGL